MKYLIKLSAFTIFSVSILFVSNIEKKLQTQFILSVPVDIIYIPEGTYSIRGTLSIEGKNILVIKGFSMDKSILSFTGQDEGAQGINITNSKNIMMVTSI
ncbi:MAG: hypothetical protein QF842_01215 [Candidatus Marinimicrobia bacterium]|jgi:hypothetical protein|nr:hypothetical protein [Candidatus Neomarinimicrobiota bacterium]MDP6611951.1 hypothetical protein [Candidatus Neomarinimicrobiota bacterium]|tara:strand:+ start:23707 stop:24006 length:300 start_codon:yes stop_codon:yes gene_type:complete